MPDTPVVSNPAELEYALTREGFRLPVIDVTHTAFAVADDAAALEALRRTFAEEERRRERMPRFVMRWLLRWAGRRSRLARALFDARGTALPALNTYAMKLGAANLVPPFDSPLDRYLAAAPAAVSMRMRLQQLAHLLAEGLQEELLARPQQPLHIINIGGGTAIDSLNGLLVLRKSAPTALHRAITIHVLDADAEGPEFGARALTALCGGGALSGLDVSLRHVPYDCANTAVLTELLRGVSEHESLVVASTEGALFEYADDEMLLANLRALRAGGVRLITGSVTRADALARSALAYSRFKLIPRGADGLATLARRVRLAVCQVQSALLSDQVLLRPA